jgi:hypothetical protein
MNIMTEKPVAFYVLHTDGSVEKLDQAVVDQHLRSHEDTGWELSFSFIRQRIGCRTVEMIDLGRRGELYVDEEGLFMADPQPNPLASIISKRVIVGDALLLVAAGDEAWAARVEKHLTSLSQVER